MSKKQKRYAQVGVGGRTTLAGWICSMAVALAFPATAENASTPVHFDLPAQSAPCVTWAVTQMETHLKAAGLAATPGDKSAWTVVVRVAGQSMSEGVPADKIPAGPESYLVFSQPAERRITVAAF